MRRGCGSGSVASTACSSTARSFARAELRDVAIDGGSWANASAVESVLRRVQFRNTRLTGAVFANATLDDVVFEDCRLDLASFRFAKLTRVRFERCRLDEADLYEARFESAAFSDCSLASASLAAATFVDTELRGCDLTAVGNPEQLRGVRMPWADVVEAAGVLAAAARDPGRRLAGARRSSASASSSSSVSSAKGISSRPFDDLRRHSRRTRGGGLDARGEGRIDGGVCAAPLPLGACSLSSALGRAHGQAAAHDASREPHPLVVVRHGEDGTCVALGELAAGEHPQHLVRELEEPQPVRDGRLRAADALARARRATGRTRPAARRRHALPRPPRAAPARRSRRARASSESRSSASRTSAGTSSMPASRAARHRRSPAISS